MSILTLVAVFLILAFVSLGLLLYSRRRNKQRRPAGINQEQQAKDETDAAEALAYLNNFYCFMLRDGTCRSGLMMDPPKQTPDIGTSESKLDDGLTQLENSRIQPSIRSHRRTASTAAWKAEKQPQRP